MNKGLFAGVNTLDAVLDYYLARHDVLASNLSNAETPNYRAKDLVHTPTFDHAVDAARLASTDPGHMHGRDETQEHGLHVEVVATEQPYGPDDTAGRLDRAMSELAANRLRYQTGTEITRRYLSLLRYAASEGGSS